MFYSFDISSDILPHAEALELYKTSIALNESILKHLYATLYTVLTSAFA